MTSLEAVFRIANFGAVIGWIVLVLAAIFGWRGALRRFTGGLVPLLLAAAYVVLLVTHWGGAPRDFSTLAGIGALFRQPAALLAGWLHYLAFDLIIGTAIAEQVLEERMPRWLLLPVLPLVFFFGPAGWLLFQAICLVRRRLFPAAPGQAVPSRPVARASRGKRAG